MDNIKLAEDTIKHLKDFIEIEKTIKKVVTSKAQTELYVLSSDLITKVEENTNKIKGELICTKKTV